MARFVLLAFALLSGVPCHGQARPPSSSAAPRTFSIRGSVRNSDDGRAVEMVKVDLKRMTGEVVGTTFTRSNGEFEFAGLPNGLYIIVVEEKDFEPIRERVEILNSSVPGMFVFLRRPLVPSVSEPGSTVSAHELSLPRKAREAMQKGMQRLYEKQDAKGSLAQFQRAVAEVPSYYEAYLQMGIAYLRLGQTADAEQALHKSIKLSEGRYADAHFALAQMLSDNERFAEAEPPVRRGLELDPNAWQGHYELARALLGLNRLDAAEKSAMQARTRKPDFPLLHLVLANIHIRKGDYPALLEDLDSFLKLDPNGPMSEKARQMREQIQRALAHAGNTPAGAPPKP